MGPRTRAVVVKDDRRWSEMGRVTLVLRIGSLMSEQDNVEGGKSKES